MKLVRNTGGYGHIHRPECRQRGRCLPWEEALGLMEEDVADLLADGSLRPCVFCLPKLEERVRDIRILRRVSERLGVTP